MRSFRPLALLLALGLPSMHALMAQDSSSNPPTQAQDQTQPHQPAPDSSQQAPAPTPQQLSVQARIRARREQRRAAAIHDTYSHLFETYTNMGYLRFSPGPHLQRLTYYAWDAGLTRYYSERLGVTVGGRGYYGTAYVGLNQFNLTRPAISQYDVMGGPIYRFYLQPKYAISGRVMGGWALGNFSGDTNGIGAKQLGLWPDGSTYAISGSIIGDANLTPNVAFRLAGDYLGTGFGGSMQNSFGFTGGVVYRFGKR
jgi:hypothetical protein